MFFRNHAEQKFFQNSNLNKIINQDNVSERSNMFTSVMNNLMEIWLRKKIFALFLMSEVKSEPSGDIEQNNSAEVKSQRDYELYSVL